MKTEELRKMWVEAGGSFHGPNIETGTMPESKLLPFLNSLVTDPHEGRYDGTREDLTLGTLPDDVLANEAFLNYDVRLSIDDMINPKPGQHMPIVWMTAVKDRIRWLSRALAKAEAGK